MNPSSYTEDPRFVFTNIHKFSTTSGKLFHLSAVLNVPISVTFTENPVALRR